MLLEENRVLPLVTANRTTKGMTDRPVVRAGSFPIKFQYFTSDEDRSVHADYLRELVIAEILLARALSALSQGALPANLHLMEASEGYLFKRPRFSLDRCDSAEFTRWYDSHGFARRRPLTFEEMVLELSHTSGISHKLATAMTASQSHALHAVDQDWLGTRARLPVLRRPLLSTEYFRLVHAIECAYTYPENKDSVCAGNTGIALEAAMKMGWLHTEYHRSPFKVPALSHAFRQGHMACLQSRADEAWSREGQLRRSRGPVRSRMLARSVRHRADHFAYLAICATRPTAA